MRRAPIYLAVFIGGSWYLTWTEVHASGFMVRENSAAGVATVFAGDGSRADDPSTVFNNPAGMVRLRGTQVEAGVVGVIPDMKFTGDATVFGTPIPGDNSRNVGQASLIPHLYGTFDITDKIKGGIAMTIPFGNTVDYAEDWSGRYLNIKTAAVAADINPNIAFRITDRLSFGAGVSLQYLKLQLSSGIPQFLIFGPGTPDASFLLDADNWAFGYNVGLLAEPMDGTRLGLTYRSKIDHRIEGSLDFTGADPLLGTINGPASADISLPATIGGSATQEVSSNLTISADVQYTFWHTFRQVAVYSGNPTFVFPEQYRDSWMISVGAVYALDSNWLLRGGVGFDQSPVLDEFRDVGVPDKDRYMVGLGFGYRFTPSTVLDFGYSHYFAAGHATMNSSVNAIDTTTGAVILNGRYNNSLNYFALSIRTAL